MTGGYTIDDGQLTVVVDVANVMGARADGWWRDRPGAALRLYGEIVSLAGRGLLPGQLPDSVRAAADATPTEPCFPEYVLVLEGRTSGAVPRINAAPDPRVRVVAAAGSGDDAIVEVVRGLPGRRLVVTADRDLRRRVAAAGAEVTGPGWMLGLL